MYLNILSDNSATQGTVLAVVQKVLEDTKLAKTIIVYQKNISYVWPQVRLIGLTNRCKQIEHLISLSIILLSCLSFRSWLSKTFASSLFLAILASLSFC